MVVCVIPLPINIIELKGSANDEIVSKAETFEILIKEDAEVESNDPPPAPIEIVSEAETFELSLL